MILYGFLVCIVLLFAVLILAANLFHVATSAKTSVVTHVQINAWLR